jgi:hypothetical protein
LLTIKAFFHLPITPDLEYNLNIPCSKIVAEGVAIIFVFQEERKRKVKVMVKVSPIREIS